MDPNEINLAKFGDSNECATSFAALTIPVAQKDTV